MVDLTSQGQNKCHHGAPLSKRPP